VIGESRAMSRSGEVGGKGEEEDEDANPAAKGDHDKKVALVGGCTVRRMVART